MRSLALSLVVTLFAASACAASPSFDDAPPAGRVSSAILNGRPSGEDENAAVYIETQNADDPTHPLRCSGRILAPALVVTARHCLLTKRSANVFCNPDGSPTDPTQAGDVTVVGPEVVSILVGAQKSTARSVAVKEIFTELGVSVCGSDIAYLRLAEPGLDTRTAIRRAPPRLDEMLSVSGWGYRSDEDSAQKILPDTRSTIERPITQTGPNGIPSDTFAIGGNSVCLGDSGAAGLTNGALLGVYSRIDLPDQCSLEANRNIFVWPAAHLQLAEVAFASIGERPWFEGERPPWLAQAGAACTADEACSSLVCDAATSTCAAPCGDDGLACTAGKTCNADKACVDSGPPEPSPPPAPPADDGCATSRAKASPASALLVAALAACAIRRRRRSATGA